MLQVLFCFNFRADEEPVDPKQYLEDACKPKCVRPLRAYQVFKIALVSSAETSFRPQVALKLFDKLK
ncbi:hypothetical protein BHE74_00003992 [Ensete ventricosum]|uniref:Uncharacterized protein n=1 Tax=Ensete ventricosum TaxID=4639 RepID=A0A427BAX3_ENSVE|nr:hypothetical protein B296_00008430 [Ensete ventricosum]RWW29426.1 hypothetical protein GW17_00006056 [Ensete ventricosum]RWW87206.1 hypothetical protein BHE74_00003992 [Ensete ventricosum]RZR79772.1 hypothetical protein BHM03_00005579 [Ensete ventricosum]